MDTPKRRLILHFDLNKTIIMKDATSGKVTEEAAISYIIAENAWGKVEQREKEGGTVNIWILASDALSQDPPGENLVTYKKFLEAEYPNKTDKDEPDEALRAEFNQAQRSRILEKIELFPKPGNPGVKFKKIYERMLNKLELPKHAKEQLRLSQVPVSKEEPAQAEPQAESQIEAIPEEGKDKKEVDYTTLLKNGRYHIIPSFFSLMRYLKKAKREYAVVFRTFSNDLPNVIAEFNALCEGKHVCFNGTSSSPLVRFDGSKGNKDFRITVNKGIMYRFESLADTGMIVGTLEKADNKEELDDYYAGALEEGTVSLLYGVQDQYVNLYESLQSVCSYAIQDDYQFWNSKNRETAAGKLLLIDDADYETHQIFFDDNIAEEKSIVSVCDLITGEPISYKRAINKYIVRVEPDKAILENDYFIKKIEECEKRRSEEIENMEKGISGEEEEQKVEKVDEWAALQGLSSSEYLMRTVLPVVYQGLRELDVERPHDPVGTFAFFLLKNQHLVKLPERSPEPEVVPTEQVEEEHKEELEVSQESPKENKVEAKKEVKK